MSKTIKNHKAVDLVECGYSNGSDYKYDVVLKEGWIFSNGRQEGAMMGLFNTVQCFNDAKPIPSIRCQYCDTKFDASLGKYGCPDCSH